MLLRYGEEPSVEMSSSKHHSREKNSDEMDESATDHQLGEFNYHKFEQLGDTFRELGLCMMGLGVHLARICDKAIGSNELEESIIQSGSAKGRLIHYHSMLDNYILKHINRSSKASSKKVRPMQLCPTVSHGRTSSRNSLAGSGGECTNDRTKSKKYCAKNQLTQNGLSKTSFSNLWQQWHCDYGTFTVLTAPLFLSSFVEEDCSSASVSKECPSPDGHTYLQLYGTKNKKIYVVKSPPENIIIQVGEAADILSRGKLRSTLHSVGRPIRIENISRETFVVFLQPAWDKILSCRGYSVDTGVSDKESASNVAVDSCSKQDLLLSSDALRTRQPHMLMQEILEKIPPLSSRFRDGMTFAEFSRETTKQYYSTSGTQSRRK